MKIHYIGLMAGLTSSASWETNIWSEWARVLQKRLTKHYHDRGDVAVYAFSSDWEYQKPFFDMVKSAKAKGYLGVLTGAGHSMGGAEWLKEASIECRDIHIPFLGILDITLLDGLYDGHGATENIKHLMERRGNKGHANIHPSFKNAGNNHDFKETGMGHLECANAPVHHDLIFKGITSVIPKKPEGEFLV